MASPSGPKLDWSVSSVTEACSRSPESGKDPEKVNFRERRKSKEREDGNSVKGSKPEGAGVVPGVRGPRGAVAEKFS